MTQEKIEYVNFGGGEWKITFLPEAYSVFNYYNDFTIMKDAEGDGWTCIHKDSDLGVWRDDSSLTMRNGNEESIPPGCAPSISAVNFDPAEHLDFEQINISFAGSEPVAAPSITEQYIQARKEYHRDLESWLAWNGTDDARLGLITEMYTPDYGGEDPLPTFLFTPSTIGLKAWTSLTVI